MTFLLCNACTNSPEFEQAKAQYLTQSYILAMAMGLKGNIWYSVAGWRNSGFVDKNNNPLPVFHAYQFAYQQLAKAQAVGEVTSVDVGSDLVRGVKFNRDGQEVWVLWSMDGGSQEINLSNEPKEMYRMNAQGTFGGQAPAKTMTITADPVYLIW